MKKICLIVLCLSLSTSIFATPEYRIEMQKRLQEHKKLSFSFDSLELGRAIDLLANFTHVKFILDPSIDVHQTAAMRYKDVTPLYLFEQTLRKFNLDYQVTGTNTIKIIPRKNTATIQNIRTIANKPPQLWSSHKILNIPIEQCAKKGNQALQDLGYMQIVQNQYDTYANYLSNRIAVKCVALNGQSFVYVAVAGEDVKLVEKLRNEIIKKF